MAAATYAIDHIWQFVGGQRRNDLGRKVLLGPIAKHDALPCVPFEVRNNAPDALVFFRVVAPGPPYRKVGGEGRRTRDEPKTVP